MARREGMEDERRGMTGSPRLDAHQHFWADPEALPWMSDELQPIRRPFLPEDLKPALDAGGFEGCVAVQADHSLEETRWLLDQARENPWIRGVVGWVDLCSEKVEEDLAFFSGEPKLRGIRHIAQDEPDDRFLLCDDFGRGVNAVGRAGLVYDILIFPRQLEAAVEFSRIHTEMNLVLDHIAKPSPGDGVTPEWESGIRALAENPRVFCKISGLVTEAPGGSWEAYDFHPFLDVVMDAFGDSRLMFGSDWPVCLLAARGYDEVVDLVESWAGGLGSTAQEMLFGGNAANIYRLS